MPISSRIVRRLTLLPIALSTLLLSVITVGIAPTVMAKGVESSSRRAQAEPPDRFYGTAKVNGKQEPTGTVVEAYIGSTLCGSGTVQKRNGTVIYVVDVIGGGQKPGCAKDGDKVTFKLAGLDAKESGTYTTGAATRLDLTASGTPHTIAEPTVLPPGGGRTPVPATVIVAVPSRIPVEATSTPPRTASAAAGRAATPSATATRSASASATGTVTNHRSATPGVSPTPSTTATLTAAALGTTTATAPALANTSGPIVKTTASSGPPAWVWVIVGLAALAIAGGAGAFFYQRRM